MKIKTTREKRIFYIKGILRWTLYYVLIFLSFIIMTSGTWIKPILLIPVAMCIACGNNRYAAVGTGALCGFLTDIACGRLFGYNAVIISVFCIIISLLFEFYLKHKFANYFVLTAVLSYIQCRLDYHFYYKIWGYEGVEKIFSSVLLKAWIYTVISSVIVYILFSLINHFLMPRTHLTIEEAITQTPH